MKLGEVAPFAAVVVVGTAIAAALMAPSWPAGRAGDVDSSATDPPKQGGPQLNVASASSAGPADTQSTAPPSSAPTAGLVEGDARCPAGMVLVCGAYCPYVAHRCAEYAGLDPEVEQGWRSSRTKRRCQRFHDDVLCEGRPSDLHFCVDQHEYPNQPGVKPATRVSYEDAARGCASEGKRLCEAEEWMFACEGQRTMPYPTGLVRDVKACNVDHRVRLATKNVSPWDRSLDLARVDRREPSGDRPRCVSPFGAHDMMGNVAEWVHNREGHRHRPPFRTALAGGGFGRDRATCRALETSHQASYRDHRSGFRCCRNALDGVKPRRVAGPGRRLPHRRRVVQPVKAAK